MPEISIIVPVYKVEPYLRHCVDSILVQTFADFELILVDDGSPDDCGAICDEYAEKDSRVRVIHQENGGVSRARNAALDSARGEIIAFCDSDDYWQKNWLQELMTRMMDHDADIVSADYTIIDEKAGKNQTVLSYGSDCSFGSEKESIDFMIRHVLLKDINCVIWTKLFKRRIIETFKIRFCETCENFAEDMAFVLEYLLHCRSLARCDSVGYYYIIHADSMMGTSEKKVKLNAMNEVSKHFGESFFSCTGIENKKELFAVIHFLIMNNQYSKITGTENYKTLQEEIAKINDKHWFYQQTRRAFPAYNLLTKYVGEFKAKQALLWSSYCLHQNWKLHSYISAVFYRFVHER